MESIITMEPSDGNPKQHVFLVEWKDYSQEENTWETYDNVAKHNMELLRELLCEECRRRKRREVCKAVGRETS